ncbi:MAG: NAD-dependent protein deacetylase [Acidobacteriota bacterium]|nr:NAD-dependent protein deacetylase [Acidobacteriota bacterium]
MSSLPGETDGRAPDGDLDALLALVHRSRRLLVLTGAGCSTESGIPDYRDTEGAWKRKQPVQYMDFVRSENVRRRYWARSFAGWQRFSRAEPNTTHLALARLEAAGLVHWLITQNVDGLHQRAGSRRVTDLHGRLDTVQCLGCRATQPRETFQAALDALNPGWRHAAAAAPDGDADLEGVDFTAFTVPACAACGGILKPAVVFFGESVPPDRVNDSLDRLAEADALLVVGSSLMVRSGYRFAVAAAERGIPIAAVNLGRTRADDLLAVKVEGRCGVILPRLSAALDLAPAPPGPHATPAALPAS